MLHLSLNAAGKIPFDAISRTFASGKGEKIIHQCLSELGLQEIVRPSCV